MAAAPAVGSTPTSILMIVIGAIANLSVAAPFVPGFLPALAWRSPAWDASTTTLLARPPAQRVTLRELWLSFVDALVPMGLPIIHFRRKIYG
jgi:TRAP-type C4-dicarboxylate transport system permease large subunit